MIRDQIKIATSLLNKRDKRIVGSIAFLQVIFGLLDLLGVAIVGMIGALAVRGVQNQTAGDKVSRILAALNLDSFQLKQQIVILGILAVLTFTIKTIFTMYFSRKIMFFLNRRGSNLTSELYFKIMAQPLDRIQGTSVQESIWILTTGVYNITVGILTSVTAIISDISLLAILTFGLFIVDPLTATTTFALFALVGIIIYLVLHRKAAMLGLERTRYEISSTQEISQSLLAYREIFVRDQRGNYFQKISKTRLALADADAELRFIPTVGKYVIEIFVVLCALTISALQFSINDTSRAIAILSVFMAASTRIAPAVLRLQQGFIQLKSAISTSKPTLDLINSLRYINQYSPEQTEFTKGDPEFNATLHIEDMSFSYGQNSPILNGINIHLKHGESLAIVGPSGSGKTTLVDLILGLLIPDSGEIKIGGVPPIHAIRQHHGSIAYVPQESIIIEGSIRENLSMGFSSLQVSDEDYWSALRAANLESFVKDSELQLDTLVGDRGTRLSGGQKQRLGIARALLTKPSLLILDEATSSLDGESERQISDFLDHLKGKVTLVVVAHRLSTVQKVDKLVYLENGQIIGIGTFNELRTSIPNFEVQAQLMGL
jgi:ABC-type multidrug transport system fused ATPase/permease subunit